MSLKRKILMVALSLVATITYLSIGSVKDTYAGCSNKLTVEPPSKSRKDRMVRKRSNNLQIVNKTSEDVIVSSYLENGDSWARIWGFNGSSRLIINAGSTAGVYVYGPAGAIKLEARNGCGDTVARYKAPIKKSGHRWVIITGSQS